MEIFTLPAFKFPWYDRAPVVTEVDEFLFLNASGDDSVEIVTVAAGKSAILMIGSLGPRALSGATATKVSIHLRPTSGYTGGDGYYYRESGYGSPDYNTGYEWTCPIHFYMSAGDSMYFAAAATGLSGSMYFDLKGILYTFDA